MLLWEEWVHLGGFIAQIEPIYSSYLVFGVTAFMQLLYREVTINLASMTRN